MNDTSGRFELTDLSAIQAPGGPRRAGHLLVFSLKRIHAEKRKSFSSLHAIDLRSGALLRLTRGEFQDREPRPDPQGRFILFASNRSGDDALYRLPLDGGEPRRLTAFPKGHFGDVVLSNDGRHALVSFTKAAPESDGVPLAADYIDANANDGIPDTLPGAPDEPETAKEEPKTGTTARVFVRAKNREDGAGYIGPYRSHLWLIDTDTGSARRLTRGDRDFMSPCFLSEQAIVAVATREAGPAAAAAHSPAGHPDPDFDGSRNQLVRVDIATGEVATLPAQDGIVMAPSVSPDGKTIVYFVVPMGDYTFGKNILFCKMDVATGQSVSLIDHLDRPAGDFVLDDLFGGAFAWVPAVWSARGDAAVFAVSDQGSVRLYEQPISGEGRYLTAPGQALWFPCPLDDGWGALAATSGTYTEVAYVGPDGAVKPLTTFHAKLTEKTRPRAPEHVTLDVDGVTVHGFYLAPRGLAPGEKAPAILFIHGGPHTCWGERLVFQMQYFADAGFAVMFTNPRGSHSFGEAYSRAIHFHWGDPDARDQLAFVDWLAQRPEVDPDRIGVGGGSYGGFMTLLLCGTTTRFKAAVSQRGLYNWLTDAAAGDYGHMSPLLFEGALPWEQPMKYLEKSPIRHVGNVKTPMLLIQSEQDFRCYNEQAFELFNALKRQGTPSALVLFPDESHGITRIGRIDRRIEQFRQMEGWFSRWLCRPN